MVVVTHMLAVFQSRPEYHRIGMPWPTELGPIVKRQALPGCSWLKSKREGPSSCKQRAAIADVPAVCTHVPGSGTNPSHSGGSH